MAFAWYGHLKYFNSKPLLFVILFSEDIAGLTIMYMKQPLKFDFLGALALPGRRVYFTFRYSLPQS